MISEVHYSPSVVANTSILQQIYLEDTRGPCDVQDVPMRRKHLVLASRRLTNQRRGLRSLHRWQSPRDVERAHRLQQQAEVDLALMLR